MPLALAGPLSWLALLMIIPLGLNLAQSMALTVALSLPLTQAQPLALPLDGFASGSGYNSRSGTGSDLSGPPL